MSDDIEKARRELIEAEDKRYTEELSRNWRQSGIFLILFTPAAPFLLWVGFWGENGWVLLAGVVVCFGIFGIMDWRNKIRQVEKWDIGISVVRHRARRKRGQD